MTLARWAIAAAVAGCTYDIPSLPGDPSGGGGSVGPGGASAPCTIEGCPESCPDGTKCVGDLGCAECATDDECLQANANRPLCDRGQCVRCKIEGGVDSCEADDPELRCSFGECQEACDGGCAGMGEGGLCTDGQCVQCVVDAQCEGNGNGNVCDKVRGLCVPCANDDDCEEKGPLRVHCSYAFECVECLVSDDCKEQPARCSNNECVPKCCEDADCEADTFCDLTSGECGGCTEDAQCAGRQCAFGMCVNCSEIAPCQDGYTCNADGTCSP